MRAYFFGNMYLSHIQQGIQAAHVVGELFVRYNANSPEYQKVEMLYEWAENHKTMILLNGGYSATIRSLFQFLDSEDNPYPFAPFHEGQDALDGALTDVGIILPEKIYTTSMLFRKYRLSTNEVPSPRQQIVDTGKLIIKPTPKNRWGIQTTEQIEWNFSQWELALCDKLNEFDLAR